jgi:hypothetical protein
MKEPAGCPAVVAQWLVQPPNQHQHHSSTHHHTGTGSSHLHARGQEALSELEPATACSRGLHYTMLQPTAVRVALQAAPWLVVGTQLGRALIGGGNMTSN